MSETTVQFAFHKATPMDEVEGTLHLARLATKSLYGEDQVRLNATFAINCAARTCRINTGSEVGRTLALIFAGFARREFGDSAVSLSRISASNKREPERRDL